MSKYPVVSVVMSVFNDELHVAAALDSILSQGGVELEFIVIDDGSTDDTGQILDAYAARDSRLRVIHQENTGLTRALIRGCGLARGKYIARQDGGGDISFPGRLRTQVKFLESHPNVVMTSCGTQFVGPEGEELYQLVQDGNELQRGLEVLELGRTCGPSHHSSTMFCRFSYQKVRGYRTAFPVGQDSDLWLRLAEVGDCWAIPVILYEARLSPESISFMHRFEQRQAGRLMLLCAKRRRCGLGDASLIERSAANSRVKVAHFFSFSPIKRANYYYFIASVLKKKDPLRAKHYYWKSLSSWPFHARSLVRFLLTREKIF